MRISDWSSDVCSSDLGPPTLLTRGTPLAKTSRWATSGSRLVSQTAEFITPITQPDAGSPFAISAATYAIALADRLSPPQRRGTAIFQNPPSETAATTSAERSPSL